MIRRFLVAAALAAAPLASTPAEAAAPPYCASVYDGGGTITYTCVVGTGPCMAYGEVGNLAWCVDWP